jgi:hypothetical protein
MYGGEREEGEKIQGKSVLEGRGTARRRSNEK